MIWNCWSLSKIWSIARLSSLYRADWKLEFRSVGEETDQRAPEYAGIRSKSISLQSKRWTCSHALKSATLIALRAFTEDGKGSWTPSRANMDVFWSYGRSKLINNGYSPKSLGCLGIVSTWDTQIMLSYIQSRIEKVVVGVSKAFRKVGEHLKHLICPMSKTSYTLPMACKTHVSNSCSKGCLVQG